MAYITNADLSDKAERLRKKDCQDTAELKTQWVQCQVRVSSRNIKLATTLEKATLPASSTPFSCGWKINVFLKKTQCNLIVHVPL